MSEAVQTGSDAAPNVSMEDRLLASIGLNDVDLQTKAKPTVKAAPAAPTAPVDAPVVEDAAETPTEAQTEASAPESIEIEFEGSTYKVPPELKKLQEGYLRQEDYTRKTQEAAEMRKVADLTLQQAQAQQALQQVTQPYLESLIATNNQIKAFQNVDWNAYTDQDPVAANKHWIAYQALKDRKANLEHEMQGAAAQHMQKVRDAAENLKKENSKILTEKVKGWNTERDQKVREFAGKNYGFSPQELGQVFDARVLRLMNDAYEWQTLQAAKPAIQKQVAQAQKTLKPTATQSQTQGQVRNNELKRQIRSAKSESQAAKGIEKLLERTL